VCVEVGWCALVSVGLCVGVCWCMLLSVGVCWCWYILFVLLFDCVCSSLFICVGVC